MAFWFNKKSKQKRKNVRNAKVIPINIKSQYRTTENRQLPTRTNDLLYTEPLVMDTPYKKRQTTFKRKKSKKNKYFIRRLAFITASVLILSVLIFGVTKFLTRNNATEVLLDQVVVGVIKDKTIKGEVLLSTAVSQLEKEKGVKIQTTNKVTTNLVYASKNTLTSDYVITLLRQKLNYRVLAATIVIDGVNKAVVKNKAEAEDVLRRIQSEYIPEGSEDSVETEFLENVTITEQFIDESDIMGSEKIMEILKSFENIERTYVVERGDSMSKIAVKWSMTQSELLAANPSYTPNSILREGDVLNVIERKPLLSVKVIKTEVKTEVIPKKVEYQDDNTLVKGSTRILQAGSDGEREVTYKTTIINGVEKKDIDNEKEIKPQVPQIIQRGTK